MSPYSWAIPPSFTDGVGNEPTAAEHNTLSNDLAFLHQEYPIRATLWHKDSAVVAGNDIDTVVARAQDFGRYSYQNASANADSFEQSFLLAAGTYTVYILGQTTTASGIVDWELDGTQIKDNQDWYSGSTVANVEKTIASVVISETGRHVFTGIIDDNNVSSSGHDLKITKIWFKPASDVT